MSGLTIGWEYLTGYCVATDPANRELAEWPPHPGRVFLALAAAWFEMGEDVQEGNALRWLEILGDPEITLPGHDWVFNREVVTVFVPVNDSAGPSSALLQSAPSITRSKQARTFPAVWVGDTPCFMRWPNATAADVDAHKSALDQLCCKVTRIGHSSSLVRMWLAEEARTSRPTETWVADNALADWQARRVSEGTLHLLNLQFNRRGREEHGQLSGEITNLETAKKAVKGRDSKQRKAEIDIEIGKVKDRLLSVDNRDPIRPKLGLWSGYRRRELEPPIAAQQTDFDSDLLILKQIDGPRLPSVSALAVAQALRGAVMKHSGVQPPPAWVSGHHEAGQPLRDGRQHLAILPLPFVSNDYADGHLLGAALAFPRWVSRQERGRILGPMLLEPSGKAKSVKLQLGALGVWTMIKCDWSESRKALKPDTWSGHPKGSRLWASVTPVVLDGFPKQDRLRNRSAWNSEVLDMLAKACLRVGLPEPATIDFDTTSWHKGSPRASLKRRPLRGHPEFLDSLGGLGDGFPPYPAKSTTGIRPQFHAWLQFAEPIVGPVLLGAGRFLGYGLCKPLWGVTTR
jgi:CRISPR-associated protein Csb2